MTTSTHEPAEESSSRSPQELADNYRRQLMETARRCIAVRRHLKGSVCRWRRAARTGPNSELALVFILRPGQPPATEVWPYGKIEDLAAAVTDEEVLVELARHASAHAE